MEKITLTNTELEVIIKILATGSARIEVDRLIAGEAQDSSEHITKLGCKEDIVKLGCKIISTLRAFQRGDIKPLTESEVEAATKMLGKGGVVVSIISEVGDKLPEEYKSIENIMALGKKCITILKICLKNEEDGSSLTSSELEAIKKLLSAGVTLASIHESIEKTIPKEHQEISEQLRIVVKATKILEGGV